MGENVQNADMPKDGSPKRKRSNTGGIELMVDVASNLPDAVNEKAVQVVNRVQSKLTGRDFGNKDPLKIDEQVQRLIAQATSHENLCQCYTGWCPFW